ncbi:hypothetical protein RB595_003498 [Gaeumannomyces hyphopodioides]
MASGATSTPGEPHTTSPDQTRPGTTPAPPSTRGPRNTPTPASGSGSGANKTAPTDAARAALGRQKSADDRVQKRPSTTAAAETQATSSTPSTASIAGVYKVTSDALRTGWPDVTGDMRLRVAPARDAAGVYAASFDFGVLEGLMLIGTDRDAIRACSRALDGAPPRRRYRRGVYQGPDPFLRRRGREEEEEQGVKPAVPVRYMLHWRGMETGEGEVDCGDFWGELKFANAGLGRFTGEMEIGFVSERTEIRGTKVSDEVPSIDIDTWLEYLE